MLYVQYENFLKALTLDKKEILIKMKLAKIVDEESMKFFVNLLFANGGGYPVTDLETEGETKTEVAGGGAVVVASTS